MAETADIVHVRDTSSGRVHKRIRVEGTHQLASFEGDNADSSGAYSVLTPMPSSRTSSATTCAAAASR
jgi:hypothetical protein